MTTKLADRGVLYMLTGTDHQEQLVVSVRSLRDYWDGPVCILAGCEQSERTAKAIAVDSRLGAMVIRWSPPRGRNAGYLAKTSMDLLSPYRSTVFLDADTLVVDKIEGIFPLENEVTLTTFGTWTTHGRIVRHRLDGWRDVEPELVALALATAEPALNTGVLGFNDDSAGRNWGVDWRTTTQRRISFICDEIAAQLIHRRHNVTLLDSRYNASVVYCHGRDDIAVWHGHGGKFFAKDEGWRLWEPWYRRAVAENWAGIADMRPTNGKMLERMRAEVGHG